MHKNNLIYKNFSSIKYEILEHFHALKWWYVLLSICGIIGILIGIFIGFTIGTDATASKIPDSTFLNYIEGDTSIIGVFFARFCSIFLMLCIIFLSNFKPYLCIFNCILLIYKGFIIGATSALLIILFNIGGVLNVIFIVLPCHLLLLFLLIGWSAICMSYNFYSKHFGGCIISRDFLCNNKFAICFLGILILVSLLLEVILLPWVSSVIIIVN